MLNFNLRPVAFKCWLTRNVYDSMLLSRLCADVRPLNGDDVTALQGEYDIPPAFYTPDQPKIAGYPNVGPV